MTGELIVPKDAPRDLIRAAGGIVVRSNEHGHAAECHGIGPVDPSRGGHTKSPARLSAHGPIA